MEGKTNFSRRLKQFDGLTWLTPTPTDLRHCGQESSILFFDSWVRLCMIQQHFARLWQLVHHRYSSIVSCCSNMHWCDLTFESAAYIACCPAELLLNERCCFFSQAVIFFSFVIVICILFMHVCCVFLNKVWVWVWVCLVAQHCYNGDVSFLWEKMETLTPCKIETLEQINIQFVRID